MATETKTFNPSVSIDSYKLNDYKPKVEFVEWINSIGVTNIYKIECYNTHMSGHPVDRVYEGNFTIDENGMVTCHGTDSKPGVSGVRSKFTIHYHSTEPDPTIFLGNQPIKEIYFGNQQIVKVTYGSKVIWEKTP